MKQLNTTPALSLKELRLLPGRSAHAHRAMDIDLTSRLCRTDGGGFATLKLPYLSAAMQAVTSVEMAVALAQLGAAGVLPLDPEPEAQARKLRAVKQFKAGFQTDILTLSPDVPLAEVKSTMRETGYSTFPVTDNGKFHGKLLGVITDKDFDSRNDLHLRVADRMRTDIQAGVDVDDLAQANTLMIRHGRGFLPIISRQGTLTAVVFKKDLDKHLQFPEGTEDAAKRLVVGAAVSTHETDRGRIARLVEAQADFLVIDASDGHTDFQSQTLDFIKRHFSIPVIAGNIVTAEGFGFLARSGADAVKVGMGIGSGCTTQLAKGTGRGQATALIDVAAARRNWLSETGQYLPIIADGGINTPADIAVALALGADLVMMGNYFARFDESPGRRLQRDGEVVKEYWMEGSNRGRNLHRYGQSGATFFEEGVSGHVPYAGSVYDELPMLAQRLKATLSTLGCRNIAELHAQAVVEVQSLSAMADSNVHSLRPDLQVAAW